MHHQKRCHGLRSIFILRRDALNKREHCRDHLGEVGCRTVLLQDSSTRHRSCDHGPISQVCAPRDWEIACRSRHAQPGSPSDDLENDVRQGKSDFILSGGRKSIMALFEPELFLACTVRWGVCECDWVSQTVNCLAWHSYRRRLS